MEIMLKGRCELAGIIATDRISMALSFLNIVVKPAKVVCVKDREDTDIVCAKKVLG